MTNSPFRNHRFWSQGLIKIFQQSIGVLEDHFFDMWYGTDTSGIVAVENLDIGTQDKEFSRRYQPTRTRYLKDLLAQLDFPKESVFVDFGSGKGRVLLVASEYGFRRVVGIEISKQLTETARKNLAIYEKKVKKTLPIEIFKSNVLLYDIREDENVFYFFRPFDGSIMKKIVEKILHSLTENPRKVWIIICASIYDKLLEENPILRRSVEYTYGGADFVVYTNVQNL